MQEDFLYGVHPETSVVAVIRINETLVKVILALEVINASKIANTLAISCVKYSSKNINKIPYKSVILE